MTWDLHINIPPQVDIDMLHLKGTIRGRGLISVEDCMRMEQFNVLYYIEIDKAKLMKSVKGNKFWKGVVNKIDSKSIQEHKITLLGEFEKGFGKVTWNWLRMVFRGRKLKTI